ncbi:MAG: alpha/beta hydrolase [Planctomycetota bacterium]
MARIQCDFFSDTLGVSTSMCAILPQPAERQIGMAASAGGERHPVLWLLHGLSDDHTIWSRRTSIERYVAPLGLAVIMPAVGRSFYTDMARGGRYWTFVGEELPEIARSFFPLSDARDANFVAGLSMGGYGAFKLAFRRPDRFAAAASLSGALDPGDIARRAPDKRGEYENVFGRLDRFAGSENDLFHLAEQLAGSDRPVPALYQCCGTDDDLLDQNRRFRDHARALGLELDYEEGHGAHDWAFWDRWIGRVLDWLPLDRAAAGEASSEDDI